MRTLYDILCEAARLNLSPEAKKRRTAILNRRKRYVRTGIDTSKIDTELQAIENGTWTPDGSWAENAAPKPTPKSKGILNPDLGSGDEFIANEMALKRLGEFIGQSVARYWTTNYGIRVVNDRLTGLSDSKWKEVLGLFPKIGKTYLLDQQPTASIFTNGQQDIYDRLMSGDVYVYAYKTEKTIRFKLVSKDFEMRLESYSIRCEQSSSYNLKCQSVVNCAIISQADFKKLWKYIKWPNDANFTARAEYGADRGKEAREKFMADVKKYAHV